MIGKYGHLKHVRLLHKTFLDSIFNCIRPRYHLVMKRPTDYGYNLYIVKDTIRLNVLSDVCCTYNTGYGEVVEVIKEQGMEYHREYSKGELMGLYEKQIVFSSFNYKKVKEQALLEVL